MCARCYARSVQDPPRFMLDPSRSMQDPSSSFQDVARNLAISFKDPVHVAQDLCKIDPIQDPVQDPSRFM